MRKYGGRHDVAAHQTAQDLAETLGLFGLERRAVLIYCLGELLFAVKTRCFSNKPPSFALAGGASCFCQGRTQSNISRAHAGNVGNRARSGAKHRRNQFERRVLGSPFWKRPGHDPAILRWTRICNRRSDSDGPARSQLPRRARQRVASLSASLECEPEEGGCWSRKVAFASRKNVLGLHFRLAAHSRDCWWRIDSPRATDGQ